jgi:hypothetical protein
MESKPTLCAKLDCFLVTGLTRPQIGFLCLKFKFAHFKGHSLASILRKKLYQPQQNTVQIGCVVNLVEVLI